VEYILALSVNAFHGTGDLLRSSTMSDLVQNGVDFGPDPWLNLTPDQRPFAEDIKWVVIPQKDFQLSGINS